MFTVNGSGMVAFPPEIKQGRSGDYLTFKVRSGKVIKDRQTGQDRVVQSYTRCVFFGDRGLAFAKRIEQGTVVSISGELDTRRDDSGKEWTSVRVSQASVPAQDAAQQPKSDRGFWRDPGSQPQYAQQPQAQPQHHAQPQQPQTPAPQYAQANLVPQGNPYQSDGDIPF